MSSRRKVLWSVVALVLVGFVAWVTWAESNPESEKALRTWVRETVLEALPEEAQRSNAEYGLHVRLAGEPEALCVVLIHGLDDTGSLWDDLVAEMVGLPYRVLEFTYPNDQPVGDSAALLAESLSELKTESVVLVGHSMGGLVSRELLTSPELGFADRSAGLPKVKGLAMLGTPNHGSEWARLRVWLELRDLAVRMHDNRFALLSSLADGAGEAKVDLRPGSKFLKELNARPMPEDVEYLLVAGVATPDLQWAELKERVLEDYPEMQPVVETLEPVYRSTSRRLGDGAVTLESLRLEGLPEPVQVDASHRLMIARLFEKDPVPAAIPVVLVWLKQINSQPDKNNP